MTRLRAKRHIPERMEACKELWFQFPAANKGKWREVCGFPDECELFLEIGCGKGKFCTETATANPQALYIALERESSVILAAIEKTKELGIKNLFFVNADAKNLLEYFEENEVDRIYLNFSDPWTRKKKPKRRLTYRDFLKVYETIIPRNESAGSRATYYELKGCVSEAGIPYAITQDWIQPMRELKR